MKNTIKTLVLLFMAVVISSCDPSNDGAGNEVSCLPINLKTGMIAFYAFSNGSINDFSSNNQNLTNTTSASAGMDRNGNANCAFQFDASNGEFLTMANPTFIDNFQTLPFSISLWYKNESSTPGDYEQLIGRDTGLHCPDTYGQWSVGLYDNRKPVFGINHTAAWWDNSVVVSAPAWRHLVVTCTGTDVKLFLDGTLTSYVSNVGGCGTTITTENTGDLFLGKEFTGLLDDIIIYNRILSQAEILELKNLTPCCQ